VNGALVGAVNDEVRRGGPAERPAYPSFSDGHDAVLVAEAVAASPRQGAWAEVARWLAQAAPSQRG
jgi:hypothetical protein